MKKWIAVLTAAGVLVCAGLVLWFTFNNKGGGEAPGVLAGLQSLEGEHYYYNAEGAPQYGWHTIDGHRYYFDPLTGAAVKGWFTDAEGAIYYFGEEGYALTGRQTIDGKDYRFDDMGRLETDTDGYEWKTENGKTYCIGADGKPLTGLCTVDGSLYCFDEDGARLTGWQTISGKLYYFHPETGRAARGWATIDGESYFFNDDGTAVVGKQTIAGVDYTFDEKGKLIERPSSPASNPARTPAASSSQGAVLDPAPAEPGSDAPAAKGEWVGKKYKLPSGEWATGITVIDGKIYGFDADTKEYVTGRSKFGGKFYHFHLTSGVAQTGWLTDPANEATWYYYSSKGPALTDMQVFSDGSRYYFDPATGARQSGFVTLAGKLYCFAGKNDSALIGWQSMSSRSAAEEAVVTAAAESVESTGSGAARYYFCTEGYALTGVQKLSDGKIYAFNEKGIQLLGWQDLTGGRYFFGGSGGAAVTGQWADHADGKVYLGKDGAALTGLATIGGSTYYFAPGGIRQGGWVTVDGKRYCFEGADDAALKSQWRDSPEGRCYLGEDGAAYTGAKKVDGKLYGFASDGVQLKGISTIEGKLYFLDRDTGEAKLGWQKDGDRHYYLGGEGYALAGVQPIDGKTYYFNPAIFVRESGWVEANGKVYLFDGENDTARTGEYSKGNAHYYFGSDGAALTGVQKLGGSYYYYNSKGLRQTGWQTAGGYRYYFDPDTAAARTGWFTDIASGGIYYFDNQGRALTGSQKIDGITYKFDENGKLNGTSGEGGWVTTDGKTYFVGPDGSYLTGLQNIAGALYYFDESGVRQSGWVELDGARYHFDKAKEDKAVFGWFTDDDGKYYFGESGAALTGIQPADGSLYCFDDATGALKTGEVTVNGARYLFDEAAGGKAHSGWYPGKSEGGQVRYYSPETYAALTGKQAIDGETYLFDDAGVRQSGWHKDEQGRLYCFNGAANSAIKGKYTSGEDSYYFDADGCALVGLARVGEAQALYFFDAEGKMQTGWQRPEGGKRYYFGQDGAALTGERKLDGDTYFFHQPDAYALTGTHEMDGRTYVFDEDGKLISKEATTGMAWQEIDGKLYYMDSAGEGPTGLEQLDGYYYLFADDHSVLTGRRELDGKFYQFGTDGKAVIGWYKEAGDTFYFGPEGYALTGEHTLGGASYSFDETTGKLLNGEAPTYDEWEETPKGWVYYNTTGELAKGPYNIGGQWYYFDEDGIRRSGWQGAGAARYYLGGENDAAFTGWEKIDGKWYVFDAASAKQLLEWQYRADGGDTFTHYFDPATGQSPQGLATVNGAQRYFAEDGHMVTGWHTDEDGSRYYFYQNGELATGVVTIEGALYSFDAEGKMKTGWNTAKDGGRYYFTDKGAATGWHKAEDGRWYRFSEDTAKQLYGWQYRPVEDGTHTFFYNADGSLPSAGFQTVGGLARYFHDDGHMATGWNKIDDKLYYFSTNGERVSGATTIGGISYPFAADGSLAEGWHSAGGKRWYFTETGALTGWHRLAEGELGFWYSFDERTGAQKTGWQTRQDGAKSYRHYYDEAGKPATGWLELADGKRWLDKDGVMATGWTTVDELEYYFFPDTGIMATGAVAIDGENYSFDENGQLSTGWNTDETGRRFYFNDKGEMLKGWQKLDERWYHLDSATGEQQLGWQSRTVSGSLLWYYYFPNGSLPAAGWTDTIDGTRRHVLADGQMNQGKQTLGSDLMYFDAKGAPYTGWSEINERWYCFDENGVQQTGLQQRTTGGGYTAHYWYDAEGNLPAQGWHTISASFPDDHTGKRYVMEDGELGRGWAIIGGYRYYFKGYGANHKDGIFKIDGIDCGFDAEGRYIAPPTFTKVDYDTGWAANKDVRITATVSSLLTNQNIQISFDGGSKWETATFKSGATFTKNFKAGTTIKANQIKIKDSLGNISSYGTKIVLDSAFTSCRGIDISSHQGNIDWAKVKASGKVDFVVVRALTWSKSKGYYTIDPKFDYNVRQAKNYGIPVGAYLYSYAFNSSEMLEEVNYFLNSSEVKALRSEGYMFDLPVFIDYEDPLISKNTSGRSIDQRTNDVRVGMARLKEKGYKAGVYVSRSWATNMINAKTLQKEGYHLWLAHWGIAAHNWSPEPALWQYSNGSYGDSAISGISGNVDRNWLYYDFFKNGGGGNTPAPVTAANYKLTVTDQNGKKVTGLSTDILAQIVEAEVGGFGNKEVYKAQAIAAHSWLLYQYSDGQEAPKVALKSPRDAVKDAVKEVTGRVLEYNGNAALTPYYAASNGYTNEAKYWNNANNYPYLTCVDSSIEPGADKYKNVTTAKISEASMKAKLKAIYGTDITAGKAPKDWIKITAKNMGGYVTGLNVCGRTPKVDYFITTMFPSIGSPSFKVNYSDGYFTFTYSGYGHCVGMSQYGAYGLATEKKYGYQAILSHYFPGTSIKSLF